MALTNIFNEPRRELTETAVGLAIVLAIGAPIAKADYYFGLWFVSAACAPCQPTWPSVVFGMLVGLVVMVVVGVVLGAAAAAVHALGESVCDSLERRGLRLRPIRAHKRSVTQRWSHVSGFDEEPG